MTDRNTKSGVNKQLVRRLQKATDMSYTQCLRELELLLPHEREDFVKTFEPAES